LFVPHDEIECRLVFGRVGDCAERMAERVKVPVPVDAGSVQQLAHLFRDGRIGHVL
jgi:hypothetical protein